MNEQYLRRIPLESVYNCRDLGGYPAENGATKFGRFLRCGIPQGPIKADCDKLAELGVKTVIDLRGNTETEKLPSSFSNDSRVEYHHFSLMEINPAEEINNPKTLDESYIQIIEQRKDTIAKVLKVIANAPDGIILYHCSLGKDRTGNLSYMLMSIAGVDIMDIKADYEVSNTYLQPMFKKMVAMGIDLFDEKLNTHLVSNAKSIEIIDSHIKNNYGSVENYLIQAGMTAKELEAIKNRLTK